MTEACVYLTVGEIFHDDHANDDEFKIISAYSKDESKHIVKRGQDVGRPFPGTTIRIYRSTTHINDLLRADDKVKESRGDINIDETAILVDSIPELYHVTEDESMTLLLIAVGEVVISGNQVDSMSGYLNLPNETQNSFVKERRPIIVANNGNVIGQRYHYRTGDEGYINPITKNIHILGRMNGMNNNTVKVNGIRIDLSEIENALIDDQNISYYDVDDDINNDDVVVVDCAAALISQHSENTSNSSSPSLPSPSLSSSRLVAYCVLSEKCASELGIFAGTSLNHDDSRGNSNNSNENNVNDHCIDNDDNNSSNSSSNSRNNKHNMKNKDNSKVRKTVTTASGSKVDGVMLTPSPLLTLLQSRCNRRTRVIPSVFVVVRDIPTSCTGKRDRTLLPLPECCVPFLTKLSKGRQHLVPLWQRRRQLRHKRHEKKGERDQDDYDQRCWGGPVHDAIVKCLNIPSPPTIAACNSTPLRNNSLSYVTASTSFSDLGGDSLASMRVVRILYASHLGVKDSRNIILPMDDGMGSGSSPSSSVSFTSTTKISSYLFDPTHLLLSDTLGDYVDFLDSSGIVPSCWKDKNCAVNIYNEKIRDDTYVNNTEYDKGSNSNNTNETMNGYNNSNGGDSKSYNVLLEAISLGQSTIAIALLNGGHIRHKQGNSESTNNTNNDTVSKRKVRLGNVTGGMSAHRGVFRSGPLHVSCLRGEPGVVRALLRFGLNGRDEAKRPDANGNYPIHLACAGGRRAREKRGENVQDVLLNNGGRNKTGDVKGEEYRISDKEKNEDFRRLLCVRYLLEEGNIPLTMRNSSKQVSFEITVLVYICM